MLMVDDVPRLVDSQQVLEQQLVLGAWALRLYHVIGGGNSGAPTRQSLWGLGCLGILCKPASLWEVVVRIFHMDGLVLGSATPCPS